MRKRERQDFIKRLIRKEQIGRQRDIQERLEAQGIMVTQTTLSRDLRELGLTKIYEGDKSFYVLPQQEKPGTLYTVVGASTRKVDRASFVLVLHTSLGEAALMANAIDQEQPHEILGTIAGADTLLVICRDEAAAQYVETAIAAAIR